MNLSTGENPMTALSINYRSISTHNTDEPNISSQELHDITKTENFRIIQNNESHVDIQSDKKDDDKKKKPIKNYEKELNEKNKRENNEIFFIFTTLNKNVLPKINNNIQNEKKAEIDYFTDEILLCNEEDENLNEYFDHENNF